jgi:hypothetical protein
VNLEGGVAMRAWAAAKESAVEQGPFFKKNSILVGITNWD